MNELFFEAKHLPIRSVFIFKLETELKMGCFRLELPKIAENTRNWNYSLKAYKPVFYC